MANLAVDDSAGGYVQPATEGQNNFMLASLILSGTGSISNAYSQSQALQSQGDHEISMARMNANLSQRNAEIAQEQGNQDASALRRKADALKGKQRASFAAQGIDPSTGTPADILKETEANASIDELQIRNNAWRKAWGFKVDAQNSLFAGSQAKAAAQNASRNTLLTGHLDALSTGLKAGYYSKQKAKEDAYGKLSRGWEEA